MEDAVAVEDSKEATLHCNITQLYGVQLWRITHHDIPKYKFHVSYFST